ncbi:MAG: YkgJ family cysteine cluster protein [Candidatus Heimdallarchaeota archaeon]
MVSNSENERILKIALNSERIFDFTSDSVYANFSCIDQCSKCCGHAYYLPSEVENLPDHIKEHLTLKNERYLINVRSRRCTFFQPNDKGFFCSIHRYRPLRCRIYPYFPVIVNEKVIITLETALKMLGDDDGRLKRCPGLSREGKPLQQTIRDCLLFLKESRSSPSILSTLIMDCNAFHKIRSEKWFIESARKVPKISQK